MKKNVVITVRGMQPEMDAGEPIEVISAGTYMRKDNTHYLTYEEADDNGKITKNRIKITPDSVELAKQGAVATRMYFSTEEKQYACYMTPFGELTLGMTTKQLDVSDAEQLVNVRLLYALEVNGDHLSDCHLDIEVVEVVK